MPSLKVIAAALALAGGATPAASMEPIDAADGGLAERTDLLSTWSSPDPSIPLLYAWSQPGDGEGLRVTWWEPAKAPPLTFAFSSPPRATGDLALTWSTPDQSRDMLYSWSRLPAAEEGAGSASGEPDLK